MKTYEENSLRERLMDRIGRLLTEGERASRCGVGRDTGHGEGGCSRCTGWRMKTVALLSQVLPRKDARWADIKRMVGASEDQRVLELGLRLLKEVKADLEEGRMDDVFFAEGGEVSVLGWDRAIRHGAGNGRTTN